MGEALESISLGEVGALLEGWLTRKLDAVHWHHSVRPDKYGYKGSETLQRIARFHREELGLADIAQHLTVAPDGSLWLGRDWNSPPVSALGHNGNAYVGPFMLTLIGNFEAGYDTLEGQQLESALEVTALIQRHFELPPTTLRFHSQLSDKACPGSALDYDTLLEKLGAAHAELASRKPAAMLFPSRDLAIYRFVEAQRSRSGRRDPVDAELPEAAMSAAQTRSFDEGAGARAADKRLSSEMLAELRPYVINLSEGRFSGSGRYQSNKDDVDAIMNEHLQGALEQAAAQPLPVLFYAHGGLVSENDGLWRAYQDVKWWRRNGVYPIYFVWETGLFETLARLLRDALVSTRAPRFDLSETTDWLIERFARAAYGEKIWSAMKRSAEQSVVPDGGGARYTAEAFAKVFKKAKDKLRVHALGHSAGTIFHSYFLPALVKQGVSVETAHLLAPAVRVDTFEGLFSPHMGQGIGHTSIFTMGKTYELADTCLNIYQKSLLYLIYNALEPDPRTPILGLEESLRADPELRKEFGLGGQSSKVGEVVFSKTQAVTGKRASHAVHHGDFNDDAPTMNSVLRRVLGVGENDEIVSFPEAAARSTVWPPLESLDEPWRDLLPAGGAPGAIGLGAALPPRPAPVLNPGPGRRRALCVGVDSYTDSPLLGCVADARLWAQALQGQGFEPQLLLDKQATRSAIMQTLEQLLVSSAPGDLVVFQFSGHGISLEDLSGDEDDRTDEALCPIDFDTGAFFLDDDIAQIFARTPAGVAVTCFLDCCYSGTGTRFAVGSVPQSYSSRRRARFLRPTVALAEAHRRFRAGSTPDKRAFSLNRGPDTMREVVFSACRSDEVALESNGQGEFTLRATRLLASGVAGTSNQDFQNRVTEAFGPTPQQHPQLDCAPGNLGASFLVPAVGRSVPGDDKLLAAVRLLTQALKNRPS